ncbi:unnamed protein product, partial [Pylaiella littoralis]
TPGPAIDLDASLVKFLKSQTDDPETKNHKRSRVAAGEGFEGCSSRQSCNKETPRGP